MEDRCKFIQVTGLLEANGGWKRELLEGKARRLECPSSLKRNRNFLVLIFFLLYYVYIEIFRFLHVVVDVQGAKKGKCLA